LQGHGELAVNEQRKRQTKQKKTANHQLLARNAVH
jgi:hypothetical protein